MTILSKEDKLQLIDSRKRTLEYKKYALELDLIVENAKSAPDADAISVITSSVQEINDQVTALDAEIVTVNGTV